ncbi:hypothetical protein MPER_06110, partial [Moniliophthora perniciosa FA553]
MTLNAILRPISRSMTPFALRTLGKNPIARPTLLNSTLLHRRTVANTVSNRPASQTFDHAALNIKEETSNAAADIAKVIAGGNMTKDNIETKKGESF